MRKLMLSLCGGLLAASAAVAQAPAAPAPKPAQVPAVMPKPATPAPAAVAPVPAPATPSTGVGCGAPATGGCDTCGAAGKVFGHHKHLIGVGTATPPGCGCHAADKTFVFGSCKQFFNPGRTCNGLNLHGGREHCPLPAYAAPYGSSGNNCGGPYSYANR